MIDIGVKRELLHEKIPLEAPLALQVTVTGACNFRCVFCHQSLSKERLQEYGVYHQFMEFHLFEKMLDDLRAFKTEIKTLNLGGFGEPLLHPQIDKMVAAAKAGGVKQVEIVTNASLLTPEVSDKLIEAGVDRLRISIEGLSRDMYRQMCGVAMDYEKLIENLAYFYRNKRGTTVYIKIIDSALKSKEDEKLFFSTFTPLADYIHVERMVPLVPEVEYLKSRNEFSYCMRGNRMEPVEICPQAFYTLAINSNGDVFPCCNVPRALTLGNLSVTSLREMWHGAPRVHFLKKILKKEKADFSVCRICTLYKYVYQPEDYLDDRQEVLLRKWNDFYKEEK